MKKFLIYVLLILIAAFLISNAFFGFLIHMVQTIVIALLIGAIILSIIFYEKLKKWFGESKK